MLAIWMLLAAMPSPQDAARYPLACSYVSRSDLDRADRCAALSGRSLHIAPEVVRRLSYDHGLASLAIDGQGWFYRRRNGRMVEMLTLDNGPDTFSEGLARGRIDGRLVYVDRQLRTRIATRYTFATPFRHGRATVCIGCVSVPVKGGEYHSMQGGTWGVIDRRGREIIPPTLTQKAFNALPPRMTGG
jgi:hypothetical protein